MVVALGLGIEHQPHAFQVLLPLNSVVSYFHTLVCIQYLMVCVLCISLKAIRIALRTHWMWGLTRWRDSPSRSGWRGIQAQFYMWRKLDIWARPYSTLHSLLPDNSDLIACTVITKDGGMVQRFLAVDIYQMSLVEPDVSRLGWGVVKFAGLLQVRV